MALSFRVKDVKKAITEAEGKGLRVINRIEKDWLASFEGIKEAIFHPRGFIILR